MFSSLIYILSVALTINLQEHRTDNVQNAALIAERVPASELPNLKKLATGITAPEPSQNLVVALGAPADEEADFLSVTQDNLKA